MKKLHRDAYKTLPLSDDQVAAIWNTAESMTAAQLLSAVRSLTVSHTRIAMERDGLWSLRDEDEEDRKRREEELKASFEFTYSGVRGLKNIGNVRHPYADDPHVMDCSLAGRVAHVFGTGMTRAIELCKAAGADPHWQQQFCKCGRPCDETGYCDDCLGG